MLAQIPHKEALTYTNVQSSNPWHEIPMNTLNDVSTFENIVHSPQKDITYFVSLLR